MGTNGLIRSRYEYLYTKIFSHTSLFCKRDSSLYPNQKAFTVKNEIYQKYILTNAIRALFLDRMLARSLCKNAFRIYNCWFYIIRLFFVSIFFTNATFCSYVKSTLDSSRQCFFGKIIQIFNWISKIKTCFTTRKLVIPGICVTLSGICSYVTANSFLSFSWKLKV